MSIQLGLYPILKESETPLMVATKKNIGDDQSAAALRTLLSVIFMSIPNLVVNSIYKETIIQNELISGENDGILFKLIRHIFKNDIFQYIDNFYHPSLIF